MNTLHSHPAWHIPGLTSRAWKVNFGKESQAPEEGGFGAIPTTQGESAWKRNNLFPSITLKVLAAHRVVQRDESTRG